MRNIETFFPLTELQQGILVDCLRAPDSAVYVIQIAWRVEGEFDEEAFCRAWRHVVERHQALRAACLWEDVKAPIQVVHRSLDMVCEKRDWRQLGSEEKTARLQSEMEETRQRGLSLARAPLWKMQIVRLSPAVWQVIWTHHHLMLDGWSTSLILAELFSAFRAYAAGTEPQMPPAGRFSDYVSWLHRRTGNEALAYWRRALAGFDRPTRLGLELAEPQFRVHRMHTQELPQRLVADLQGMATAHRLTPAAILHGAWAATLARIGKTRDVVFGSVLSGRSAGVPYVETMAGCCINTLPFRVEVGGALSAAAWLQTVQGTLAELVAYESTPLLQAQSCSGVSLGTRMFDSILAIENFKAPQQPGPDRGQRRLRFKAPQSRELTAFPLLVKATAGAAWTVEIQCDSARYSATDSTRLLSGFLDILSSLVTHPEQPIERLAATETEARLPATMVNAAAPVEACEAGYAAPRDSVEYQLALIFSDILGLRHVGIRDSFFDLGGHSLLALRVLNRVKKDLGWQIPFDAFFESATVEGLAVICRKSQAQIGAKLLVRLQNGDPHAPIFFVHPAGGNCLCYLDLARRLGDGQMVYGLQSYGLNPGSQPDREIGAMARRYVEAMKKVHAAGPWMLAGWSTGGVVAFEMAQLLMMEGGAVDLLALIDCTVPDLRPASDDSNLMDWLAEQLDVYSSAYEGMDPARRLEVILEAGKARDWWPPDTSNERGRVLLDVFIANTDAANRYRPRVYPGTVTFFSAATQRNGDPADYWEQYVNRFERLRVPGEHPTLMLRPHVEALAAELQRTIETRTILAARA